jgi:two-component sensor histidine kinase
MTMQQFDVRSPDTGRWLNIRVSPVSHDLFHQTFVDVTDRRLLEEQRGQMLMEMSHRVANNFQMVASFLRIQSLHAEPVAQASLRTAEGRVQVLAKLHSLLAYTESHREIDVAAYVGELCDQLRGVIDRPADITLRCACEPLLLAADKVVPIGFIVSELVTNAVKYAFPPPATGVVSVTLKADGETWVLTVEDDGRGLAEPPEDRRTPPTAGGLGTRLIRTFVNQIGGTLTVRSNQGVAFEIRFAA